MWLLPPRIVEACANTCARLHCCGWDHRRQLRPSVLLPRRPAELRHWRVCLLRSLYIGAKIQRLRCHDVQVERHVRTSQRGRQRSCRWKCPLQPTSTEAGARILLPGSHAARSPTQGRLTGSTRWQAEHTSSLGRVQHSSDTVHRGSGWCPTCHHHNCCSGTTSAILVGQGGIALTIKDSVLGVAGHGDVVFQ